MLQGGVWGYAQRVLIISQMSHLCDICDTDNQEFITCDNSDTVGAICYRSGIGYAYTFAASDFFNVIKLLYNE